MPNHDSLQQIRWKIWRAREGCEALDVLTQTFLNSGFCSIAFEQDRKKRLIVRIAQVRRFPPSCSLLIGEIAHNLRSALDHLIFSLAGPSKGKEKTVQFPLCNSRMDFKTSIWRMPGVPRGVVKLVESVQPYHRRKWPETRFLGQLQAINNWDKHRSFALVAASIEDSVVEFKITGKTTILCQERFRGRIKSRKIIARLEVGYSEVGAKIESRPILGVLPVFDDGMPEEIRGSGIRGILNGAGHFIETEVLPRFERFF